MQQRMLSPNDLMPPRGKSSVSEKTNGATLKVLPLIRGAEGEGERLGPVELFKNSEMGSSAFLPAELRSPLKPLGDKRGS